MLTAHLGQAWQQEAQGLDSQKLLGHTPESAHKRHLRSEATPVAEPVSLKRP